MLRSRRERETENMENYRLFVWMLLARVQADHVGLKTVKKLCRRGISDRRRLIVSPRSRLPSRQASLFYLAQFLIPMTTDAF